MSEKLYQEELIEHFKYAKHRKKINNPHFNTGQYNPSCGDQVSIEGIIENNIIKDLGFAGSGCVISQASTSMLTEACIGLSIDQVKALTAEDIKKLIKIPIGPTRLKCALLSLHVLQEGLSLYKKN